MSDDRLVSMPSRPAIAAALIAALAIVAVVTGISLAGGSKPAASLDLPTPSAAHTRGTSAKTGTAPTGTAHPTAHPKAHHTPTPHPTAKTTHQPPQPTARQRRHTALAAVRALAEHEPPGAISVAAVNTDTGARFTAGADGGMWTASAYKLFVLETLLWQQGGPLGGEEADLAIPMIEQSDNSAAWDLYQDAGGRPALVTAAARFGMSRTIPGDFDPTLTTTCASDYLHLLRNLVDKGGPLTASSKAYALNLMRNVEADQRWGVGVVADKGSVFYNKNGWLSIDNSNPPGETDNGLWAVTSVGIVQVHGQRVLMAVFTRHQPDMETGVQLVQRLAKAIAPAVAVAR